LGYLIEDEDDDEEDSIPMNFQTGLFEAWAGLFLLRRVLIERGGGLG
jgi:hypothetical protein